MKYTIPVLYESSARAPVASSLSQVDLVHLPVHCIYHAAHVSNSRFFPFWFSLLTSAFLKYSGIKNEDI